MLVQPLAVALFLAAPLLGWLSPDMQVYFRLKELLAGVQKASPTLDPELSEVAGEASALLSGCGLAEADGRAVRRAVERRLAQRGRFGDAFVAFAGRDGEQVVQAARDYFAATPIVPGVERIGIRAGAPTVAVVARSRVKLPALPPERWRQESVLFWGELPPGYRAPEVLLLANGDQVQRVRPDVRGALFYTELPLNGVTSARVEVLARGPYGNEVLTLFEVGPQEADPCAGLTGPAAAGPQPTTARAAEEALLARLNEFRTNHGLPALEADARLARVARGHSADMAHYGFVGHDSPNGGPLSWRMQAARYPYLRALENVAAAGTLDEVHDGLVGTPSHRLNLLDREVQRAGVGVVSKSGVWFVTEVLACPAR
jgi:uncharacterized protein YkwD